MDTGKNYHPHGEICLSTRRLMALLQWDSGHSAFKGSNSGKGKKMGKKLVVLTKQ